MKKEYRTPEMEIVTFDTEDIIRTSGDENIPDGTTPEITGSYDDSIDEELV